MYEAVKNTALHCEDGVRNAKIYMYTVYFAVLAFGFNHRWIHLVSFVVLIAFQSMINSDRIAVERASSFIRIFFESQRKDMHWSLLNKDPEHIATYRTQYQNIGWYINHFSASILASISLLIMLGTTFSDYELKDIPCKIWAEVFIAVILYVLVIYINKKTYVSAEKHKDSIRVIDSSIKTFYEKCYKDSL